MNSWTLRQQRTRQLFEGERQEHTTAMRAARYVRRHAMEFHGAGVADAVRDLAAFSRASQNARAGVASVLAAFQVTAELAFGLCPDCKGPNLAPGLVHQCPVDRVSEAAHGPSVVAPADCPDCSHAHVEGQHCTKGTGPFHCGCTG